MMDTQSHYDVLEVARTASPEVIQAAYRRLCQKYHPDRNRQDSTAHEKMVRINAAYEVLTDPSRRRAYDASLAAQACQEPSLPRPSLRAQWGEVIADLVLVFVVWLFIFGVVK